MKKRLISFLLTLVMLVSLCSVFTVSASADAQVATVTIGSGDTVLGICQKYGIDYYTYKNLIMTLNGMTDESQFRKLAVGAKVVLPVSNTAAAALAGGTATVSGTGNNTAGTATGSGLTTGTVSNLPAGDHVAYYLVTYTVQKGETIGGIYSNMGLSYKTYQNQIVKLNNLRNINAVQAGQTVATVRDTSVMLLAVDFPAAEAQSFAVGQAAQVMPDTTFEVLNGTIRSVSGADPYQREETVVAAASGTVSELCVREGSTVRQDDVLLRITGKDLDKQAQNAADNLRSAELRMSSAERNISHYTIDAPISGTIVDKKVKAGDKLSANDAAMQNLCTIYDMSYLELKLNVDELKIRSLKVGQEVEITADAVPGETYKGTISSILVAGTTANGSTSYPVTVRIDEMGDLLPGMNASAKITTASVKDVLALPNAALVRGSYVLVTKDSPSAANAEASMTAPDGYVYVKVTTGISDDDYIEVKSGLQEGDTIAYDTSTVSATDFYSTMMASAEGGDE